MQPNPLFSVLIANYNNGAYLQEAIDSVLSQTYANWEVIIVDDASTDNSQTIYNQYQFDARFHIYHNEGNKGCGYTKWRCIELANGEICGVLDADDKLSNNALELMVDAHLKHEKASIITSRSYICDSHLNIESESRLLQIPQGQSYLTLQDWQPEHFTTFKRALYNATSKINYLNKMGIDQDLCFLLEEVGEWVVLDEFLYYYRCSSVSISHSHVLECFYYNLVIRHDACRRRGISDEQIFNNLEEVYDRQINKIDTDARNEIRRTLTYRIGNIFAYPFKKLKERR